MNMEKMHSIEKVHSMEKIHSVEEKHSMGKIHSTEEIHSMEEIHSDDELIERIRCGDKDAAEELIKRYYTSILRYCKWHCADIQRAEDLTQETFFRLFRALAGYNSAASYNSVASHNSVANYTGKKRFKAYLYTIANHLCIDESRKIPLYALENEESLVNECNEIQRAEDREEVRYLLNTLSSEQREAVILRFGEQLEFREIAQVMGCNMRTAQSRVRSALKIMRKEKENER